MIDRFCPGNRVSSCPLGDPSDGSVQAPGGRRPAGGGQLNWKRPVLGAAGRIIIKELLDKNAPRRDNWGETRTQRGPQVAAESQPGGPPIGQRFCKRPSQKEVTNDSSPVLGMLPSMRVSCSSFPPGSNCLLPPAVAASPHDVGVRPSILLGHVPGVRRPTECPHRLASIAPEMLQPNAHIGGLLGTRTAASRGRKRVACSSPMSKRPPW